MDFAYIFRELRRHQTKLAIFKAAGRSRAIEQYKIQVGETIAELEFYGQLNEDQVQGELYISDMTHAEYLPIKEAYYRRRPMVW